MPELPEVETIRQQLSQELPLKIQKVTLSPVVKSILKKESFSPLNLTIKKIHRKGKLLCFQFNKDQFMLSHFGMSGGWRINKKPIAEKHTHVHFKCINLNKETYYLGYVDPRRFGNMYFVNKLDKEIAFNKLGADVSTGEFNLEYLTNTLKKYPNKQLKSFLLDQKYFAGVGNYIASEICAHARIRPTRRVKLITSTDRKNIVVATKTVIEQSFKSKGVTFSAGYYDSTGSKGEGAQNLVVFYQDTCGLCKKIKVKKINLAGRGTYYCPSCQK